MPSTLNAPGIYIEELPSGVHPIVGVSTSDTAFVDWFPRGPVEIPTRVTSMDEFTRIFGGVHPFSAASYAVLTYFLHGGAVAWIVRANVAGDVAAKVAKKLGPGSQVTFTARSAGTSGNVVRFVTVKVTGTTFNLHVQELTADETAVVTNEVHRNVSLDPTHPRYFVSVTNQASSLVTLTTGAISGSPGDFTIDNPLNTTDPTLPPDPTKFVKLAGGTDASPPSTAGQITAFGTSLIAGLNKLTKIEPAVVNLVCLPSLPAANLQAALDFCEDSYAFLIVDPPEEATTKESAVALLSGAVPPSKNAALYWPRITVSDPAAEGRPRNIGPSGAIAGTIAKTDATRGVWKAPAGIEATLGGVQLAVPVTDGDSQVLNPVGINVLRTMPVIGNVVWGARTLFGADVRGSEWKYIPVRRTALFIEQSLNAGLKWVVFEPNDEPLWSQIRLNVGSFMQDLFRKGAFQGTTPRDAYFVRCDKNTTTQSDIDKGIVNILVGFAPLKPAEFVVIQIQQMAGQANA